MSEIAKLWARRTASKLLAAWCPFCRHEHFHGGADGHRVAHCRIGRGFDRLGGYHLVEVEATPREIREHNEGLIS